MAEDFESLEETAEELAESIEELSEEEAVEDDFEEAVEDIEDTEALMTKTQEMMADPDICGDYEKLSELSAEITRLEQLLQEYYEQLDEML